MDEAWEDWEKRGIEHKLRESIWGTPETVKQKLEELIERTGAMIKNSLLVEVSPAKLFSK